MKYPLVEMINKPKEMLTYFAGYVNKLSCQEGSFYREKNITTEHFPVLSCRRKRGQIKTIESYQGMVDKEELVWVANSKLYIGDVEKTLAQGVTLDNTDKTITKMGAYLVIFPDKVWYNTKDNSSGKIEATFDQTQATVTFQQVDSQGEDISYVSSSATTFNDGDYKIDTKNGKKTLKTYSKTSNMWINVATTYFKISCTNIGKDFKKGDGIKVSIDLTGNSWSYAKNIFVNDEGNNVHSNNFVVKNIGDDYIIVTGLLNVATKEFKNSSKLAEIKVERKCPDMAFVCECMNRLWGCSTDGHELYASKLGDVTNWNCFDGVATDSWSATVGSDGGFTGAYAYMGNPIFFKEDGLLRITISSYGAHSYKEVACRGVQTGCSKSLSMLNELLYYKSPTNVCVYDGNFPQEIGDDLGSVKYYGAVGGSFNNRYYLSMKDESNKYHLFVFDVNNNLWSIEDNTKVKDFARHGDDLFFVDKDNKLWSCYGSAYKTNLTLEGKIDWEAESGFIGYSSDNKKYLARFTMNIKMEVGAYVSLFIEYDSSGRWEHVWNLAGKGTKSFSIPVRPKRCDHYRYKLVGHGDCKVFSVSKEYEEGSEF